MSSKAVHDSRQVPEPGAGARWTHGDLVIEEASPEDAEDMHAVHLGVLAEGRYLVTRPHEYRGSVEWLARLIAELGSAVNAVFLVARKRGELVGYLRVRPGSLRLMHHKGKISLMVAREARGAGVGKALLGACVDWARGNPVITKLGVQAFADDERAVGLCRSLGFQQEGHRQREYRIDGGYRDEVLMYLFVE